MLFSWYYFQLREKIAQGDVDLVVGTHALLTGGIQFKNLGLLVVDEEQRFGVKVHTLYTIFSSCFYLIMEN